MVEFDRQLQSFLNVNSFIYQLSEIESRRFATPSFIFLYVVTNFLNRNYIQW